MARRFAIDEHGVTRPVAEIERMAAENLERSRDRREIANRDVVVRQFAWIVVGVFSVAIWCITAAVLVAEL